VIRRLKGMPETRTTPVVVTTASALDRARTKSLALGASDYLTKPIDWQRLVEVIRKSSEDGAVDILVVEDETETREVLRRVLSKAGWNVTEAANGKEGLVALAKHQPSVILLDLMMPGMDGFQFVQELRHSPAWKHIPVIVITAKDLSESESQKLAGSVSTVLSKGWYSTEDLFAELDRAITRRKTVREEIST